MGWANVEVLISRRQIGKGHTLLTYHEFNYRLMATGIASCEVDELWLLLAELPMLVEAVLVGPAT